MSETDETPDNSDKTILSVDDDPVNQMVISSLFESEGYNVVQAMDGFEALDYMKANLCPDIVLLDVMMPGLSGYEVLDKLREDYSSELPVIMISAKASLPDRIEGLTHFCNDYQTKPFEKNELLQRVASWIALRRLVIASHETAKTRNVLVKTTPSNIVPAILKDGTIVSKLENVITMVIYVEKIKSLFETHLKEQMRFLQFLKIISKFNEQLEALLISKRQPYVHETTGCQITLHFTEYEDIIAGCKFVTGLVNDIIALGEKFTIVEKLTLDRLIRIGLSCGRGIGGVVNGRYAISTGCYIESLVLAEKGIPGHGHMSYLMKSAASLQPAQVVERAKFNGRATYILKKTAAENLPDATLNEDLGMCAGSEVQGTQENVDTTGPRSACIQACDDDDDSKHVQMGAEADVPPIPPVEPPKKPLEPIVRRRGDMIREELRSRIQRLMVESQVEMISGNSALRFQTLRAMYGPRSGTNM